jgi:hypothetical protein
MNEGWLFRLRSSLGSHQSVPAWPSSRTEEASGLPPLRRPTVSPAAAAEPCAIEAALCGPIAIESATSDETA